MRKEKCRMQIEKINQKIVALEKRLSQLGILRVCSFLGILGGVIIGTAWHEKVYYLGSLMFLICFGGLIHAYNQIKEQKQYEEAKKIVTENQLKRLGKQWLEFKENGSAYIDEGIPRIKDLDLLGKGSVFQYLCSAHTPYGKKALAKALIEGADQEDIKRRQEAIKELVSQEAFSMHLKTLSQLMEMKSAKMDEESIEAFIKLAANPEIKQSKWIKALSLLLPFATFFSIAAIFLGGQNEMFAFLGSVSIVTQVSMAFFSFRKHSKIFETILRFGRNVEVFEKFLLAIETQKFKSAHLKALKESICEEGGPKEALKSLGRLSQALELRLNAVAYIAVSGLLMWDFHCKDIFCIWAAKYGRSITKWLSAMGEMEVLLSLSTLCEAAQTYSFPTVTQDDKPAVSFKQLKHPLIQEAVGNDLEIGNQTYIITGSNMSGKTTFLRTIGVNLALAYAGAPVLAQSFCASRMEVQTSMRMQDDVNEGISSFYAELLRIKGMIDKMHNRRPMLALIDEIFKGTNSADRILGAKETISVLEKPWVIVMVSTHDFELCEIGRQRENGRRVCNYHFEEYYKENHIGFDYKLKEGRCRTTNAQFLLQMVGIAEAANSFKRGAE